MSLNLKVNIEINGRQTLVGTITGNNYNDATFQYDINYLNIDNVKPISINLPLTDIPYDASQTRNYFEGLLPEGFSRIAAAGWANVDSNNYLDLLSALGRECIGAIQIVNADYEQDIKNGYIELSMDDVKKLAREGATKSTEMLVNTHLSLAGATGKVGLYFDDKDQKWYLPLGGAPSTHIIKQSHLRYENIVINEKICMDTAKNLGLNSASSSIINLGLYEDENILYATKRFDRKFTDNSQIINQKIVPYRLHQEDFSQALNINSINKYEVIDNGYLLKMFDLIYKYSSNPITDQINLWDYIIFNYLIGNTDCHIKNFSLIYNENLTGIRLAPLYDVVSTVTIGLTHNMPFYINGKNNRDELTRNDFKEAATAIGLGEKIAMNRYDYISDNIKQALNLACTELANDGCKEAEILQSKITSIIPQT